MAPLVRIGGDILKQPGIICHQCNTVTKSSKGLATAIFTTFPFSDIYKDGTVRSPGQIIMRQNICNMIAQL